MMNDQTEIDALRARLEKLESGGSDANAPTPNPSRRQARASRSVAPWIAMGVITIIGVLLLLARNNGESLYERDNLALRLAGLEGNQTCNIAWLKANDQGLSEDRTPSIFAPQVRVVGPPRVLSCPMIKSGGVEAEPLIVFERCRDVDMDCVDLRP